RIPLLPLCYILLPYLLLLTPPDPPVLPPFFLDLTSTPALYTLSLHDALPISSNVPSSLSSRLSISRTPTVNDSSPSPDRWPLRRSEEHTSELQSRFDLVCRLLLEKKNIRAPNLANILDTGGCPGHVVATSMTK